MAFRSRLPVEFNPDGSLVPIAVSRERHQAHLRTCYPELYPTVSEDGAKRRPGFAAGSIAGAVAMGIVSGLVFWFV